MDKKSNKQNARNVLLPGKPRPPTVTERANADADSDVARVLEHISSPFRWEVLEIPSVLPVSSASDNKIIGNLD